MLPPFIIEQIRKREREELRQEQPQLELPKEPMRRRPSVEGEDEKVERGVVIVDL
jgi:hypothetical protein